MTVQPFFFLLLDLRLSFKFLKLGLLKLLLVFTTIDMVVDLQRH